MATVGALLLKSLIPLFILGMAGSAIVVIFSLIDDVQDLLSEEED